jgi:integrase
MANIRKRNGKWQAQVRRDGYPSLTKTFIHRRDAETWARQSEAGLDRAALPADPKRIRTLTLGALVERYAVEVTPQKLSAYAEMSRIRILRADAIYKISLAQLSPVHIAEFLQRRLKVVSGETARKDGKLIRHIIDMARKTWGIQLASNPALLVDLPPPSKARTRRLSEIDRAQLDQALKRSRSPLLRAAIELAVETGMRRGELLRARWTDLSADHALLTIPQTKTDTPRTIPLTPGAREIISALRALPIESANILPMSANALRLAWERLRRRAKVQDLRFHDLRHEAVSRFFEMGLSVPEVALISGHRDPRMLFRYTHLRPEDIARKLAKINQRAIEHD